MHLQILDANGLLSKHRELLDLIDHLEKMTFPVDGAKSKCSPSKVALSLGHLVRELRHHFEAERSSLEDDFDDDPQLRDALRELDGEHSEILARFNSALHALERSKNWADVVSGLRGAITMFRKHEAQEDALFRAVL